MATSTNSSTETIINMMSGNNSQDLGIDSITVLRGFGFDTAHLIQTKTPSQEELRESIPPNTAM